MINADRTDLSPEPAVAKLPEDQPSFAVLLRPVGVNAETLELMNEIDRVFTKISVLHRSRQIAAYLPRNGFPCGSSPCAVV